MKLLKKYIKKMIIAYFLLILLFTLSFQRKNNFFQKLENTDDCKEKSFLPNEENVKIIGRFYQKNDVTWIVHSGSSLEFYITGISAEINLVGDSNIYSNIELRPRFGIYINDELLFDLLMSELDINLELFKNEEEKKTKVKIMLLSENKYGGIGIKNINVYTCNKRNIIEPVAKKNLSIEFIGDSMTCAYGVEGKDENEHFKTSTENFSKSYAYLASKILNVDYSAVSYSGYGVASGYSEGEKNSEDLVSLYYKKIGKHKNYPGEWDFEKYKNDIIFINLGANDYNYYLADPEKRGDEFIQEYIKLLDLVKECNPDSLIICTIGNIKKKNIYRLVEKAIKMYGDEKVLNFEVPEYEVDKYGSDWHPSIASQEKIAKIVADNLSKFIKKYYNNS